MNSKPVIFNITYAELNLSPGHIEKILGYKPGAAPAPVFKAIEELIPAARKHCQLQAGYCRYGVTLSGDLCRLEIGRQTFSIEKRIGAQLKKASEAVVFVATAGAGITQWSKDLFARGEELAGYMADVIGSEVAEYTVERMQALLESQMREQGFNITNRYSPGYCGWPVTDQKALFSLLPQNFCGITLTDSCLMLPRKSVSGIIGIGANVKRTAYQCRTCDVNDCLYRDKR